MLKTAVNKIFNTALYKNRYYVVGLVIQKGFPFLIIPLVTWGFGRIVYTQYVLVYSVVIFLAIVTSLGNVNAVIVFWQADKDKSRYLADFLLLSLLLLLLLVPASYFIFQYFHTQILGVNMAWLILLIILFVAAYNFNSLGISVLRALMFSKQYCYVTALMTGLALVGIILLGWLHRGLLALLLVYIGLNFLTGFAFLLTAKIPLSHFRLDKHFFFFCKRILSYSAPVMLYTLLTLSVVTVDKWLIKVYFNSETFIQYVYNFQFAYAVNLIATVMDMYNVPLFARYYRAKQFGLLRKSLWESYILTALASFAIAVAAYFYAHFAGIVLTEGYVILCCAYFLTNLFIIQVDILQVSQNAHVLFIITIIPTIIFWLLFFLCIKIGSISGVYLSNLFYYALLMASAFWVIKRKKVLS